VPAPEKKKGTNLLTSLFLVLPLLVFYELGILTSETRNGADLITQTLLQLIGLKGFLAVQGALLVAIVGLAFYLRKTEQFEFKQILPVLLESAIYALTMGTLILFVMEDLMGIDPRLAAAPGTQSMGIFDRLVMSAGAGVHEELVFRLLIMGGLILFFDKVLKLRSWLAIGLAMLISSIAFSAAHHIGQLGDPVQLGVFVYRVIAGLFFAALYRFRSFAIAVYSHTLYDVYVLVGQYFGL
jgi:membrane protease YdiL (CAAX protease family)